MTHIAGHPVVVEGRYQRQLCAWCGHPLIDNDLARCMVMEGGDGPGTWPVGRLIEVSEVPGSSFAVCLPEGEGLPPDSCAIMEITR